MKFFPALLIVCGIVAADQISKAWASWAGWVHLNQGISFTLLSSAPSWFVNLLVGAILLAIVLMVWSWRQHRHGYWLVAVLAAGFSNWLDRVLYGGVRDWLVVPVLHLKNNLADWYIAGSLVMLVFTLISHYVKANSTEHPV